jgi:hypothetical protein
VTRTIDRPAATAQQECAWCGKPFKGSSTPRWVFTAELKPLGLMHTSCAMKANPRRWGTHASHATELEAQFREWTSLLPRADARSVREDAILAVFAYHPSLEQGRLSEHQEQWVARFDPDRQREIRAAYDQLVGEFHQWRRSHG